MINIQRLVLFLLGLLVIVGVFVFVGWDKGSLSVPSHTAFDTLSDDLGSYPQHSVFRGYVVANPDEPTMLPSDNATVAPKRDREGAPTVLILEVHSVDSQSQMLHGTVANVLRGDKVEGDELHISIYCAEHGGMPGGPSYSCEDFEKAKYVQVWLDAPRAWLPAALILLSESANEQ